MSKSVRLPDYLAAEVERLANEEKRSLANMVKVLLEQALKVDTESMTVTKDASVGAVRIEAQSTSTPQAERRKRRLHPCKHHVPSSRVCEYCDS